MSVAQQLKALQARSRLSQAELAARMQLSRNTSLTRYFNEEYMRNRRLSPEIAAKMARAMVGLGEPPITAQEIWALAEAKSGVAIGLGAVTVIPLLQWDSLTMGRSNLLSAVPVAHLEVVDIGAGAFVGVRLTDGHAARVANAGSVLVIDTADTTLRDGSRYVILWNGEPMLRRYRANPERWESEAMPSADPIWSHQPVEIIGRAIRVITELS